MNTFGDLFILVEVFILFFVLMRILAVILCCSVLLGGCYRSVDVMNDGSADVTGNVVHENEESLSSM